MGADRDARVAEIFSEAVALPESERKPFLDRACGGDEELRAEVTSLISYDRHDTITEPGGVPLERRFVGTWSSFSSPSGSTSHTVRRRAALLATFLTVVLAAAFLLIHRSLRERLRKDVATHLEGVLEANVASFRDWMGPRKEELQRWARHPEASARLQELADLTQGRDVDLPETYRSKAYQELSRILRPFFAQEWVEAVNAVSREYLVIFAGFVGDELTTPVIRASGAAAQILTPVFAGETVVVPPYFPGEVLNKSAVDRSFTQILIATPVRSPKGQVVAVLTVRFRSEPELTRRLQVADSSLAGETYAFNSQGVMVSRSRYEKELKEIGIIPNEKGATSVREATLRDPGGDLTSGFEPETSPKERPLTRMAALATSGESGLDLEGYRDYRGKRVVGAWRWLPEYNMGVATEWEYEDAYGTLHTIRGVFIGLVSLVGLLAIFGLVSTLSIARLRRQVLEARRLGQYRLEEVIGEGGNAMVYLGRHALLQRPVAIKLLKRERVTADDSARFEREVQLVSRLNHTNTIQIFDYGETKEGTLFYVMELVSGITLNRLVGVAGPLPAPRVIFILRQVCRSLKEAHDLGIVHRDIKPGNVMICDRTDSADLVKVLDFGLARTVARSSEAVTAHHLLGGTPVYIAPERIRDPTKVDARSDIYSLGGVGYYLLTAKEIVEGASAQEVFLKTMHLEGRRPSGLRPDGIPAELDEIVARCLSFEPERRPQSVVEILGALDRLAAAFPWSEAEARAWWADYRKNTPSRP